MTPAAMRIRMLGAATVLIALVVTPRPVCAQSDAAGEHAAVLAAVQRLFDAMRTADTAALRAVFHPDARLVGIRRLKSGDERVQALTPDEFIAAIARDSGQPWIERIFDPEVRVSGTLASVWAEYDFHLGPTFSHCGVDAVHLLKLEGAWKIVGLADTFVREGCPRREPPVGGGR